MEAILKIDPKNPTEVRFARYCKELGYDVTVNTIDVVLVLALLDDFSRVAPTTEDLKAELNALFMRA